MHSVLGRQLEKLDIDPSQLPSAESWKALLERISLTYAQADQDRYMLERSLATSSSEMQSLYDQLRSATELELGKKQVELANSLALAHAVQESVAEAIVVCDGTEVLTWNRRFIELWAIPNDVLVTRDMHAFVQHARSQVKDGGAFADMATLALMNPAEVRRCDVELLDGPLRVTSRRSR